jgi:hypothetical protein
MRNLFKKVMSLVMAGSLLVGSMNFCVVNAAESDDDLLLATTENDSGEKTYGNFNFNVTGVTNFGKFKASKASGTISFSGCSTGAARIRIHSGSYTGTVICDVLLPDYYIYTQYVGFSMTTGNLYYITIEPWDGYVQAIGGFGLNY